MMTRSTPPLMRALDQVEERFHHAVPETDVRADDHAFLAESAHRQVLEAAHERAHLDVVDRAEHVEEREDVFVDVDAGDTCVHLLRAKDARRSPATTDLHHPTAAPKGAMQQVVHQHKTRLPGFVAVHRRLVKSLQAAHQAVLRLQQIDAVGVLNEGFRQSLEFRHQWFRQSWRQKDAGWYRLTPSPANTRVN